MPYLFTSESVSEGHPDKVSDQISDAVLDAFLTQDPNARVACETLCTTGLVVLAGEINSIATVDAHEIVRAVVADIGYTRADYMFEARSCGIQVSLHQQSPDIARGVDGDDQGAGDQGMMFGYATRETPEYMPMALAYAHKLVSELAHIRKLESDLMPYLRPDAKSQVTIEYDDDGRPLRVHTIVVSTQHDEFGSDDQMQQRIHDDVLNILLPRVIPAELRDANTLLHVNPTGKFVIGGPHGDAGLTGRKIIVDTYGGKGAHGGGAFSGKDPSKVDRSAAYACRHIAKNLVAAGVADEILIQVAYAIGVAQPVSVFVNTYGAARVDKSDAEIAAVVSELFDLRPRAITERLGLHYPIYRDTAAYGHMGRVSIVKPITLEYVHAHENDGIFTRTSRPESIDVRFFPWEHLDYVDDVKTAFSIH